MDERQYYELVRPYTDAQQILLTRLRVLGHNLYEDSQPPIHFIQDRIKKKESIEAKLQKKGKETSVENAKDYLQDIAGIRVICYFAADIYNLLDVLKRQSDLLVIRETDYIAHPKENGYRSYHVIFGIPVCCLDGTEYFPVEVQFRTLAMDFWASMEHRVSYKKECKNRDELTLELLEYADTLMEIEQKFQRYKNEMGKDEIS